MKPLVSVIIPCYNAERFLGEAIESALNQDYKDLEVIVVDDGSTDSSSLMARKFGKSIRLLRQPQKGPGAARNAGARVAKGKYIAFLDADDKLEPEFVSSSLKAMPSNGYTYTKMLRFGQRGDEVETYPFDPIRLVTIGNYIGIGIVVKRAIFLKVGGFDEKLTAYEDWDLWLKFLENGVEGKLIPEALYLWRWHAITRNPLEKSKLESLSQLVRRRHLLLYLAHWPQAKLRKLGEIWAGKPIPILLTPVDPDMKLSVIIPSWNGKTMIGACLESLSKQTQSGLEIIVVENGSTDGSAEFITEHFPEVNLLKQPQNLGFAGGVNVGIRAARGQAIAVLNNDAVAKPNWAAELLDGLKDADIVQAKILKSEDPDILDSAGDGLSQWGLPYPTGRDRADSDDAPRAIFSASGGAVAYRRSVFETIGLFDEDFFAYVEDFDLSFRARLAGINRIKLIPSAVVLHQVGATSSKIDDSGRDREISKSDSQISRFQLFYYIRNTNYLFYKDYPLPLLVKTWPHFVIAQLLLFASAALNGAILVALKAHLQVLLGFPKILVKRRRIIKHRQAEVAEIEKWVTNFWPFRFTIIGRWRKRLGLSK